MDFKFEIAFIELVKMANFVEDPRDQEITVLAYVMLEWSFL